MKHDWTNDWIAFTEKVASIAQQGDQADFARTFSGAFVRWHGLLTLKDLTEPAPLVEIETPEISLNLGDGRRALMDGISLPILDSEVSKWRAVPLGAEVTFDAQFVSSPLPFPAVEMTTLSSGTTLIMLRLTHGSLIQPDSQCEFGG